MWIVPDVIRPDAIANRMAFAVVAARPPAPSAMVLLPPELEYVKRHSAELTDVVFNPMRPDTSPYRALDIPFVAPHNVISAADESLVPDTVLGVTTFDSCCK